MCGQRALSQALGGAERGRTLQTGRSESPPSAASATQLSTLPGLWALPTSRPPLALPNARKLAPHSPTAPGHPPGSAQTAPALGGAGYPAKAGHLPVMPPLYGTHYNFQLFVLLFTLSP